MLVIQADSAEVTLPPQWRLLWVADSTEVAIVAFDSLEVCEGDTAQVYGVEGPSTPEDSTTHGVTAHFCSGGSSAAEQATFVLDLPAWGRGKLKVVALDPADSNSVIESNEVTFNGGVSDSFPPVILLAFRSHPSTELRIRAIGLGLAQTPTVEIVAPDSSWRMPLNVVERSNTSLTAVANVAADLPSCMLRVGTQSGLFGTMSLDADTASALSVIPACVRYMSEYDTDNQTHIQPKDFAVVAARDSFHIFYIRRDMRIHNADLNETTIGHKRSHNLNDWKPETGTMIALQARPGQWDNLHVWAPSIVKKPDNPTYWMFYTGVKDTAIGGAHTQVQRIGVATSTDLNIWTPETTWVYSHNDAQSWTEQDSTTFSGQQFRDPFVMEDPDTTGHYLMFFVAGSKDRQPRMVVGVAKSTGDLRQWRDVGPLWNTDSVHTRASIVESPHAFTDAGGRWWLCYTGSNPVDYVAVSHGDSTTFGRDSAFVCFATNDSSPAELDTTTWSAPDTLYRFLGGDPTLPFWHGSEYLKWAPGYEYLLAYDDRALAVDISEISWHGSHIFALSDSCAPTVPSAVDPTSGQLKFTLDLLGARPARGLVRFRVQIPSKMRVRLAVYDLLGRRVQILLDDEVPAGQKELRWDGRSASGGAVGSGVYFARLTTAGGQRVARVVLLR